MAANTPIKCTITNPDGTLEAGISVSSDILRGLQGAEHVRDLDCSVQMKAGYGEFAIEDWKERACFLRKSEMDKQGYVCGDEVLLTVYYYFYDVQQELRLNELLPVSFKIVGQIGELGLMEIYKGDNVRFSYKGTALYVQDGTFIAMADRLKTAIRILTAFLLPMGILIFIVGYVISHLLASGRVKEFALFRSLGVKAPLAVWVFWCEQFVLVLAGNILGCLAALLAGRQGIQEVLTVCGAAFGGYMLGTTVALALLAKEKPLELLTLE